ncbi:hypothetical protein CE655_11250 [Salmonella enterica]|nr:hypothetical protein [Salmonella enterica]
MMLWKCEIISIKSVNYAFCGYLCFLKETGNPESLPVKNWQYKKVFFCESFFFFVRGLSFSCIKD